ncbi:MAG: thioredoxin [Alphaproteobacteria bacterium]|nr:thioredoxin [Alphaproteobacteria bacterium]
MAILGPDGAPQSTAADAGAAPAGAPDGNLVKDGTDQSFMEDVIEPSKEVPVLVDFWAPWCGPCRTLGPIIERAVTAAQGAVKLVKVNIDENPGVAGQLRIQSIPAVIAFKDGQPLDGFMGALPESQVTEFIKRISGQSSGEDIAALIERADAALAQGDAGGAAQDYANALQMDRENPDALAGLARVYMLSGEPGKASEVLDSAPEPKKTHPAIAAVRASLELAGETEGASDLQEAEAAAAKASKDPGALFELGRARLAAGDMDGAANALLDSIAADREFDDGAARRLLLRIFDAAGPASDLAKAGRRRLSSILFS